MTTAKSHKFGLRQLNRLLACIIIVINSYVIILPILPKLTYWYNKKTTSAVAGIPYKTNTPGQEDLNVKRKEVPKDNRIVIPSIALDQKIHEGTDPNTVHKGVWARPNTSTPSKGGNTVLVGHRFTYGGPATFYHLDKVIVGDRILVYWQEHEYNYVVKSIKTVPATATEVEGPTAIPTLTLYTCTPLWSAKDRLVVVAERVEL